MMFSGQASIDHLAAEIDKKDPGESSHWQKYHSDFRFLGDHFEGLQGFGGIKPHGYLRAGAHYLMQRRFRRMGRDLPQFKAVNAAAHAITRRQGRVYDLDVLRQALTVALLKDRAPEISSPDSMACVIGDGFASLTSLLLASGSAGRVILVNLTKTLLVDLWYLRLWMGPQVFESSVDLVTTRDGLMQSLAKPRTSANVGRVIAIQAAHHALIRACPVDLALNIASMQEMDPPVVAAYFADLRAVAASRRLDFYCCNREEKTLPDGTQVRFSQYPWHPGDRVRFDEPCPWHQVYYSARPPFFRSYDGPIRHRLATLAG